MFAIRYPNELPINQRRNEIVASLRAHQTVIVAGETGSGKSTQLPKMCLEALTARAEEARLIGCTQPRRVAALSVSRRVAEELGVTWGQEVGCKIRFDDRTNRATRVKFMTDGILLAEIQSDPMLRAYGALIIDEAHERSLNIDFLLGYLQGLLRRRPHDLKLIITSATIDTAAFSQAFGNAPVVEVSGRLFPVEIRYAPAVSMTDAAGEPEDVDSIEAAVRVVENALIESDDGDVLVFMPTERDIRDVRELLENHLGRGIEVLGLFGRMPANEQTRIFSPGAQRRVIVATNIAETSLTIPRIRYVIDTGLARISRYNPRTRTKRLPVEAISQSSANQRAGRAGRLQDGVCIRLYDEDDFQKRPRFTQPEIQRANLAEVILRMKAFRLGEIETFPFLNPPPLAAIRAGYALLHELGALNDAHELTALGRELARLPVDPTLGRMLLQARHEGALSDVLVIAAGLSVPDPRERPDDAKEAAAAAHRAFDTPHSDFATLLAIWRAMPVNPARNALRRFAKSNYLSQARLREWRDIHAQLADVVTDGNPAEYNSRPTANADDAIHRSVLTGLLGQIAIRKERNIYQASGNRQVTLFPGSSLYQRQQKRPKGPPPKEGESAVPTNHQPPWIVAAEIVQTSQLFARTVARIDPEWVVELGAHLCKFSHTEPHWSEKAERVLAWEKVFISGLEIFKRRVDYGKIDSDKATELFIRGALVAGEAHITHRFYARNAELRERIEATLTRVRDRRVNDLDEAFYRFYAARISNVSSLHDLNQLICSRITREPDFLCADEEDILPPDDDGGFGYDKKLFPETVTLDNALLPLSYAYAPGEERDGVTVSVPLPLAEKLSDAQLQWMVPGLREELISTLLRALPKTIRRTLLPLEPKVTEVVHSFQPGRGPLLDSLAAFLANRYAVEVKASDWPASSVPAYLQPRIEVTDRDSKPIATGRDLQAIRATLEKTDVRSDAWERAARQWEKTALKSWSFGDLPASVVIETVSGVPLLAYPGLSDHAGQVDLRLFRQPGEAENVSRAGVRRLAEHALEPDLARARKELGNLFNRPATNAKSTPQDFRAALDTLKAAPKNTAAPSSTQTAVDAALQHITAALLTPTPVLPLTAARFQTLVTNARRDLPTRVRRVGEIIVKVRETCRQLLAVPKRYPGMEDDVRRLAPTDFPARTPPGQLDEISRYLRAVAVRAERAAASPAKDADKARALAPFADWETRVPAENHDAFRWLLEEFRVSIFAQELGTAQPVSPARLRALGDFSGL